MRHLLYSLAICLVSIPVLHAQQAPTLGTSPPSLNGPRSSRTANPRLLVKMRKVYIQWIDNNLNEKLADDIGHISWLKVVDKENEADAVVRGTCFSLRRLKRLHAEIYISDRDTGKAIWNDVVVVPYDPPGLSNAVGSAASEILAHLNQSVHEAAR